MNLSDGARIILIAKVAFKEDKKSLCVCEYLKIRYNLREKKSKCAIRQCFIQDVLICELDSLKEIGFVDWEDNREVWLKALYPPLIGASISFAKHDNIHHLGFDLRRTRRRHSHAFQVDYSEICWKSKKTKSTSKSVDDFFVKI